MLNLKFINLSIVNISVRLAFPDSLEDKNRMSSFLMTMAADTNMLGLSREKRSKITKKI